MMKTITINGTYTSAVIYTTDSHPIEDYAMAQLTMLCDNPAAKGCRIRVMPDVHPGKVGTIGLTMTIRDKIMPNLIGIDVGCGITLAAITGKIRDFQKLDTVIRTRVPSGFSIRNTPHSIIESFDFTRLYCYGHIQKEKSVLAAGTLGSGNHFIEIDRDEEGTCYLAIHSGSRHLGKEVTEYYLCEGQKYLRAKGIELPYELTYLEGELMEQYLHDLSVLTDYACISRKIMLTEICKAMKWKIKDSFDCIHNYVDASKTVLNQFGFPMLRKGAISAKEGEKVVIPVNMHDGILLGSGLGNPNWNLSAPHGSGRIFKREDVKNHYTVSAFKSSMKDIYCSCIGKDTLDEAPFAYRNMNEILDAARETVKVEKILHPVYNFKGGNKL